MTFPWFVVAWIVATVAFFGYMDNHKHEFRRGCTSDSNWVRHPDCDNKRLIHTTGEQGGTQTI